MVLRFRILGLPVGSTEPMVLRVLPVIAYYFVGFGVTGIGWIPNLSVMHARMGLIHISIPVSCLQKNTKKPCNAKKLNTSTKVTHKVGVSKECNICIQMYVCVYI